VFDPTIRFKSVHPGVPATVRSGLRRIRRQVFYRTVSFFLGADTRRVLGSALGFGSSRKRVWHHP
jgi:hypothetical protein